MDDQTGSLRERVAVLEEQNRTRSRKEDTALADHEKIINELAQLRAIILDLQNKVQPLIVTYEGQVVDRRDFVKMLVGAIITMVIGLLGIAILSPAIQQIIFGHHP